MNKPFKYDEIESHFLDFVAEQNAYDSDTVKQWHKDGELHHHAFNMDYYIIGTYQAKQWLGDRVFEVIDIIKEYEQDNFGEVTTDLSDPERVVNMYTYIIGEQVVSEYELEELEELVE